MSRLSSLLNRNQKKGYTIHNCRTQWVPTQTEPFNLKCLALAHYKWRKCTTRFFDTTALLHRPSAPLDTYHFQCEYHGYPINGEGLPQDNVVSILLHFIQDAILDELEHGFPVPTSTLLWTKGTSKVAFLNHLLQTSLVPSPLPLLVRKLEDIECLTRRRE